MKTNSKIKSEFLNEILSEFSNDKITYTVRNIVALKEIESAYKKRGNIIFSALNSLSKEHIRTVERFETLIKSEEKKLEEKKKSNKFKFYIPISYNIRKKKFRFLGKNFKAYQPNQIHKTFKKEKFEHCNNDKKRINIQADYPYLYFENYGDKFTNSFNDSYPIFESLQGLINYCITTENFAMTFPFTRQEAEFSIKSVVFGIDKDGVKMYGDVDKLSRGISAPTKTKTIGNNPLKNFNYTLSKLELKPKKNSIDELLYSVFRLYYTACNSTNKHEAFLNYWQICEAISYSQNFRGDTKTILNRISSFVSPHGLIGNQIENSLQYLGNIRNDIVHRGIDNSDQEYLMILKYYVDRAIIWLFQNKDKLRTIDQLEYYFKFRTLNNKTLNEIPSTIKFIESIRK